MIVGRSGDKMDKEFVTMEKHLCPICGTEHETNAILIDKKMRKKFDRYTTTGYGLCKPCQAKKDEGYLALIVCDKDKSTIVDDLVKMENAVRTGDLMHMKRDLANDMFDKDTSERDFIFIDTELFEGLKKRMVESK